MSLNFDLQTTEFWDPQASQKELLRVFDVCHGCRVCESYCPSFVNLFQWVDENFGDVEALSEEQVNDVVSLCYQCKLCYSVCPYVPPHEWDIDFPRTMMRASLVAAKQRGASLADRLFGDTDLVGSLASLVAPLVNWANRNPFLRGLLEKLLGVHKDRLLPTFHTEIFAKWFHKRSARAPSEKGDGVEKVALFHTCTVNYNEPEIGKATVGVFEKNGIEFLVPDQQCCGLPFLDVGLVDLAIKKIESNVAVLSQAVRQGYKIVVPAASCSYMLKQDYPRFLPTDDARLVAENTYDLSEYLMKVHGSGKLDLGFTQHMGKIRYHQPCHLKVQNIGFKGQELMKLIPGTEVARMQCCSGHDGTWSVKKENFEASMKVGRALFKFMKSEDACPVTDCPLSAVQIQQGTGQKPVHPIVVMARAYGLDLEE
ncbi:MAG: anaerobic glycerol-3-phosphate dehydrogenase subunit C [Acidobacteria bacterium]|nr:anaerobic glycerol-3-phosphate dehydrogenase subunit C [Acidobacteriota bacterium]